MKIYLSPETKSLQVNPQTVICASAEAPKRSGSIGTMTTRLGNAWS